MQNTVAFPKVKVILKLVKKQHREKWFNNLAVGDRQLAIKEKRLETKINGNKQFTVKQLND